MWVGMKGFTLLQNEVWVFMELMATCLQRLFNRLQTPIPEDIVCKMAVSVREDIHLIVPSSGWGWGWSFHISLVILACVVVDSESTSLLEDTT